jgi:hypothetical protein
LRVSVLRKDAPRGDGIRTAYETGDRRFDEAVFVDTSTTIIVHDDADAELSCALREDVVVMPAAVPNTALVDYVRARTFHPRCCATRTPSNAAKKRAPLLRKIL